MRAVRLVPPPFQFRVTHVIISTMIIRAAQATDWPQMWAIFQAVVATETTYVFASDTSEADARAYFLGPDLASWVADDVGRIVGMSRLVPNRRDIR